MLQVYCRSFFRINDWFGARGVHVLDHHAKLNDVIHSRLTIIVLIES